MSLCRAQDVFMAPNINSIVFSKFKPFYRPKLTGSFLSDHDRYSSGRMRDKNVLWEKNNNYKEKNKQKQCLSPSFSSPRFTSLYFTSLCFTSPRFTS